MKRKYVKPIVREIRPIVETSSSKKTNCSGAN